MEHLYITDLDKTLLRSDLTISKYTKKIWNQLSKNGIKLTIATARSAQKSLELLSELDLKHPMIVMDGAMVITNDRKIHLINAIDKERANKILQIGKKYKIEPFFIGIDENKNEKFLYTKDLNPLQQQLISEYKKDKRLQFQDRLTPLNENVKTVYIGKKELLEELKNEFLETFNDSIEIKFSKDPYIDGYFLTLLHPKGDKAHALRYLREFEELSSSKTVVFGDSHNDIEIFKLADEKIAVSNAIEELKKIATSILPHTNDEDAVARYLSNRYGLN